MNPSPSEILWNMGCNYADESHANTDFWKAIAQSGLQPELTHLCMCQHMSDINWYTESGYLERAAMLLFFLSYMLEEEEEEV